MLTRELIERHARQTNEQMARINATVARRDKSRHDWQIWKEACHAWHTSENKCFELWPLEARDKMRAGDRETIEDALLFLEVDPWFFRSGYLKERVIRHLKSAQLSKADKGRLRNVIFAVAIGRNRREWRDYCRLALAVWTPEWEGYLREQKRARGVAHGNKLFNLLQFLDAHRDKLRD